jgi:16S rRNA (cytosine967-C5)-methyltransferase
MTLGHLAGAGLTTPFQQCQPAVQAALVCGGAQMLLLNRVPDHAAVSLAVKWVTMREGPKVGGFVNAGLRRLGELRGQTRTEWTDRLDEIPLADGRALGLTRDVFNREDDATRLSMAASLSRAYVRRWCKTYAWEDVVRMALHSICTAPTIVNASHVREPVTEDERARHRLTPHDKAGHFVFGGDRPGLIALLEARPDVWVQDPASSASLELAADLSLRLADGLIIDVCAGKGTKTRQLAAMYPQATIVASDAGEDQFRTLKGVFAGHGRVRVEPFGSLVERYAGRAALVLLDVPCSNSGVLARRVEARYRGSSEALSRICSVQREIVALGANLLTRGEDAADHGAMLYATCSLEEQENQEITRDFATGLGLRVERDRQVLPAGGPGMAEASWHDGSYACLLQGR